MKTDQLIRALAADTATRSEPVGRRFAVATLAGLVVSGILFALVLGPRADVAAVAGEFSFLFKFIVTLTLAFTAAALAVRLARPGMGIRVAAAALLAAPIMLGLAVLAEYSSVAPVMRSVKLFGSTWISCLTFIPILSIPILAGVLLGLRHGAPARPALAGAVAGLAAGGFGAAIYAAYCIEDSPFFLATWYSLAIAAVTIAGALIGARLLRW